MHEEQHAPTSGTGDGFPQRAPEGLAVEGIGPGGDEIAGGVAGRAIRPFDLADLMDGRDRDVDPAKRGALAALAAEQHPGLIECGPPRSGDQHRYGLRAGRRRRDRNQQVVGPSGTGGEAQPCEKRCQEPQADRSVALEHEGRRPATANRPGSDLARESACGVRPSGRTTRGVPARAALACGPVGDRLDQARNAAAALANWPIAAQSPAASRSFGVTQVPPTQTTLGQAR